ncbi:hypothetical protein MPH_06443 [Macrophomina phaseolina MS6]|uniref:Uncharacterized protein n=1 Tax=Macrophomina phaseolina (strain MS6) TaxID=1126212 RepID=K2RUD7_MACPH|nr:hypothetical protein MPH_06443 [Macrophomina phaseolina MS6]
MNASFWKVLENRRNATFADGRWLHISMYLLLREIGNLMRDTVLNPEDQAQEAKVLHAHESCKRICGLLPAWYIDPQRAVRMHESPLRHRIRLETLMLLRICCIYTVLPLLVNLQSCLPTDPGSRARLLSLWDLFTSHLQAAAAIAEAMPPAYYRNCDPQMSTAIWIVGCMVCLCGMLAPQSSNFVGWSQSRQQNLERGFDVLRESLAGFARTWKLSGQMLAHHVESLESVRGWQGLQLQLNEVLGLLARLQVPVPVRDADSGDPYEIDVVSVCKDPPGQMPTWWPNVQDEYASKGPHV